MASRDEQLNRAADRIKEMVEENERLAKKLEKSLTRAQTHAENYGDEMTAREDKYKRKVAELETRYGVDFVRTQSCESNCPNIFSGSMTSCRHKRTGTRRPTETPLPSLALSRSSWRIARPRTSNDLRKEVA